MNNPVCLVRWNYFFGRGVHAKRMYLGMKTDACYDENEGVTTKRIGKVHWLGLVLGIACSGCATTNTESHIAAGSPPLCTDTRNLGKLAVVPELAWRIDQKEASRREVMAALAITRSFAESGCGEDVEVLPVTSWASTLEQEQLDQLAKAGYQTAVFLRIEELGPTLMVTFSLPFLWSGTSDAEFRLRAIQIEDSVVLLDTAERRSRVGPFHLRPAAWAAPVLQAALTDLLRGNPNYER